MRKKNKFGQSEMVGFVLIVVVVVVAAMVFLIISLRQDSGDIPESIEVSNLISSVLKYTSDCEKSRGNYRNVEDLITGCADGDLCYVSDTYACDVLNETLVEIMDGAMETEATLNAYQVDVFEKESGEEVILRIFSGTCEGDALRHQKNIYTFGGDIVFKITLCKSDV